MKKFRPAFSFLFLFIPPFFMQGPQGTDEQKSIFLDSAYVAVITAFAEKGIAIDYRSNPALYFELHTWLGTPHRRRGQGGIDCSGLVKIIFRKVYGLELLGSSQDMARLAAPVALEELNEGDLVFFRIYHQSRIDHVGIFLGNGRFIHTSSSSGVIVSDLSNSYYKRRFVKAGRILPKKTGVASLPENQ
jgi:murein DD-endopeptidase / murein LD-carboxypeptidase